MNKVFTISVLILILSLTVTGVAQTAGIVDGHDWTEWKEEKKEAYILGIVDSVDFFTISMQASFEEEASIEEIMQRLEEEGELTSEEDVETSKAIEKVDKFYEDHSLDVTFIEMLLKSEEFEEGLME